MANEVDLLLLAHDERDIYDEEILLLTAIHEIKQLTHST